MLPLTRTSRTRPRWAVTFALGVLLPSLAAAATYWVAPGGDDAAAGSREHPWASPVRAVSRLAPGDTVVFRGGLYPLHASVVVRATGTDHAWITLMGYPGERPVFEGKGWKPRWRDPSEPPGIVSLVDAAYVRVRNLHVQHSRYMGFAVFRPAHHIAIEECSSDETFGPGIGLWNCDNVKVLDCEVTGANTNRMGPDPHATREAPHEAISCGGATHFEIAYNHVHDCDKEGIDIKEVSAHGVVHHNYVHDMPRQGLYADAWFGTLHDVEFRDNVVHDCEWGIGVSVEDKNSDLHDVQIHHNLFYRNRGSGVYFTTWGAAGPRSNVTVAFNTLYRNGSTRQFSGPTGSIDVRSPNERNVTIENNLCAEGGTFEIGTFANPDKGGLRALAAKNIRITHNLIGRFHPIDPAIAATVVEGSEQQRQYGRSYALPGEHPIEAPAGFVDAVHDVFLLRADSAARGTGLQTAGETAPPDVGAFPYGFGRNLPLEPQPERVFENVWRTVQPTLPGIRLRRLISVDGQHWSVDGPDPVGNGVRDIRYFTVPPGSPVPRFRYEIVRPAANS